MPGTQKMYHFLVFRAKNCYFRIATRRVGSLTTLRGFLLLSGFSSAEFPSAGAPFFYTLMAPRSRVVGRTVSVVALGSAPRRRPSFWGRPTRAPPAPTPREAPRTRLLFPFLARSGLKLFSLIGRRPPRARLMRFRQLLGRRRKIASMSIKLFPLRDLHLQGPTCRLSVTRERRQCKIGQVRPLSSDPTKAARRTGESTCNDTSHLGEKKLRRRRVTPPVAKCRPAGKV